MNRGCMDYKHGRCCTSTRCPLSCRSRPSMRSETRTRHCLICCSSLCHNSVQLSHLIRHLFALNLPTSFLWVASLPPSEQQHGLKPSPTSICDLACTPSSSAQKQFVVIQHILHSTASGLAAAPQAVPEIHRQQTRARHSAPAPRAPQLSASQATARPSGALRPGNLPRRPTAARQ